MKKSWGLLIFVLCCYAGAGGLWYWYFTYRPLTEDDFDTVDGTLKSAQEKDSYNQSYLELYLVESPIRFRIPVDRYEKEFNRAAFFANVKPGTKITIKAEKGATRQTPSPAAARFYRHRFRVRSE